VKYGRAEVIRDVLNKCGAKPGIALGYLNAGESTVNIDRFSML